MLEYTVYIINLQEDEWPDQEDVAREVHMLRKRRRLGVKHSRLLTSTTRCCRTCPLDKMMRQRCAGQLSKRVARTVGMSISGRVVMILRRSAPSRSMHATTCVIGWGHIVNDSA